MGELWYIKGKGDRMARIKIECETLSGALCWLVVFLDGSKYERISQKSSTVIEIEPGTHTLRFKDSGMFTKSKEIEFTLQEDDEKYVTVGCGISGYKIRTNDGLDDEIGRGAYLIDQSEELKSIIAAVVPDKEKVELALKGAFREYLVCTDKKVYVLKKGYMTGHNFGRGNFSLPYASITNIEIDFHLGSGYFEISAAGLENKRLSYWASETERNPATQPNCIALTRACKDNFEKAKEFIIERISGVPVVSETKSSGIPEQIREYKALLDDGIISQDEFETKKTELLSK